LDNTTGDRAVNALCEIAHAQGAWIDDGEGRHSRVGGATMMTKRNLSKIAEMVLVSFFALAAVFVTLSAAIGPPSLWVLAP
jgi:hypothetical protein